MKKRRKGSSNLKLPKAVRKLIKIVKTKFADTGILPIDVYSTPFSVPVGLVQILQVLFYVILGWLALNSVSLLVFSRNRKLGTFCVPLAAEQCTIGLRCGWSFRCKRFLSNPHPWLREPGDQGSCNSCWAFSAVHSFNDRLIGKKGSKWKTLRLSVQNIMECTYHKIKGRNPCYGGAPAKALNALATLGVHEDYIDPYVGMWTRKCDTSSQPRYFASKTSIQKQSNSAMSEEIMRETISRDGPIVGAFEVYDNYMPFFRDNPTGIYMSHNGAISTGVFHGVEIVGFGERGGVKYWLAKNSWGKRWADGGYFRIKRGSNFCHIEDFSATPILAAAFDTHAINAVDDDIVRNAIQTRVAEIEPSGFQKKALRRIPAKGSSFVYNETVSGSLDALSILISHFNRLEGCSYELVRILETDMTMVAGKRVQIFMELKPAGENKGRCPPGYFYGDVWLKLSKNEYTSPTDHMDGYFPKSCPVNLKSKRSSWLSALPDCSIRYQILTAKRIGNKSIYISPLANSVRNRYKYFDIICTAFVGILLRALFISKCRRPSTDRRHSSRRD